MEEYFYIQTMRREISRHMEEARERYKKYNQDQDFWQLMGIQTALTIVNGVEQAMREKRLKETA